MITSDSEQSVKSVDSMLASRNKRIVVMAGCREHGQALKSHGYSTVCSRLFLVDWPTIATTHTKAQCMFGHKAHTILNFLGKSRRYSTQKEYDYGLWKL